MTVYNFTNVLVKDVVGGNVKVARREIVTATDPATGLVAAGLTQAGQPVSTLVADDTGHVSWAATIPVVRLTTSRGYWTDVPANDLWSNITVGSVPFAASGEVSTTKAVRADDARLVRKSVNTGTGLTGGGLLDVDRTLAVDFAADGVTSSTKAVRADDSRLWGNVAPLLANNTDFDTVTDNRTVYVQNTNTHANRPDPANTPSGILRSHAISASNILHLFYVAGTTNAVWRRWKGSSSWTAWARIDGDAAVTTATAYTDTKVVRKKLNSWRAARDAAATSTARIVCFGDSRTEGTGTTDVSLRWQTILQGHLRRQFGVPYGATFPFIPAYPQTSAPGFGVARAGTVVQDTSYGLGWRTAQLRDATSQLTFTFTGTSFKIMYLRASASAVMSITIDGGAATIVNTNSVSGGSASNAALWASPALTAGSHTVVITRDASSAAGQYVYVEGLLTFNGDETSGIRTLDAGYHGANSTFYTTTRNQRVAAAVAAIGSVGLVIIAMGTNDGTAGTAPATYRANLEGLIAELRNTGGFSGSVILLNLAKPNNQTEAQYAPLADQMAAIAAADSKVEFVDMRREQPDVPPTITDVAGLGLYNDGIHENNYGHAFIAGKLAEILGS